MAGSTLHPISCTLAGVITACKFQQSFIQADHPVWRHVTHWASDVWKKAGRSESGGSARTALCTRSTLTPSVTASALFTWMGTCDEGVEKKGWGKKVRLIHWLQRAVRRMFR